jgi:hypothetical protein
MVYYNNNYNNYYYYYYNNNNNNNNNKFWKELVAYFPWYDTDPIENDAFNNLFSRVYSLPR